MTRYLIVWADGIGTAKLDPRDADSVLLDVVLELITSLGEHGVQATDQKVPWKASMARIGGNTSWHNAAHEGVIMIDDILNRQTDINTKVILLGYSGGCKVIHDWLASRQDQHYRVAAVGYLSDPFRPADAWQAGTPDPGGRGIAGDHSNPLWDRTFWTSFYKDVISSCPDNSPLRTLADLSDKIPGSFVEDFGEHQHLGNWQLATYIGMWRKDPLGYLRDLPGRMRQARIGVQGYLLEGTHTKAYTNEYVTYSNGVRDPRPLTVRIAHTISYKVRKDLKETR